MNKLLITLIALLAPILLFAQQKEPEATLLDLQSATNDSLRYVGYMKLGFHYQELNRDSSFFYYSRALEVSKKNNKEFAQVSALVVMAYQLIAKGDYAEALQNLFNAFDIIEKTKAEKNSWLYFPGSSDIKDNRTYVLSQTQHVYSILMNNTGNTEQEVFYLKEAIKNGKIINDPYRLGLSHMNLGYAYLKLNVLDSVLFCEQEALKYFNKAFSNKYLSNVFTWTGDAYLKKGNRELAKQYYYSSIQSAIDQASIGTITGSYYGLSKYYKIEGDLDSSIYYTYKALESIKLAANSRHMDFSISDLYENLADCYEFDKKTDSVLKYQHFALKSKDSIYLERINNLTKFQNLNFNEQLRLRDIEKDKQAYQSRIRTYFLLAGLAVFTLIAFILFRNNRQKQKANKILQEQKDKVESTLLELKSTQAQLIQSEKMASLGELTAGIAHEIQNPLNFVTNFSEVSNELMDELNEELDKGDIQEAKVISTDIKENLSKITLHGKRADAIVKGMLEHSKRGSGQEELTDINALAEEFLRLSYQSFLAKNKEFQADLQLKLDPDLPKISAIPQDIGKVLLNLYSNAFYACAEQSKLLQSSNPNGYRGKSYSPQVTISTKNLGDKIEIKISDNGPGIPEAIKDKIFQPFFTTKPTGQGTGLGLSLSYDIVKAHGGEMKVISEEGNGSEFIIQFRTN